jgi:predicted anti-sigma-YlaC factor YlaD
MTRDVHQQAREWIALGADGLSETEQSQFQAHLRECAVCCESAEQTAQLIRSLRSVPMTAQPELVRRTQGLVRMRARQLQRERERLWLVGVGCLGVGLSASVTTTLIWRGFAWLGTATGVPALVWQTGLAAFLIAPALLVSLLFLVRGTHLSDGSGRWQA